MAEPLLEVQDLARHYAVGGTRVQALDGVDLAVEPKETLAVVGESGSGKTTLGKLMLGIEPPSAGRVLLRGTPLPRRLDKATRRRLQVVQQNPMSALNPKRTVRQSVELPLAVHGLRPRRQRGERVAELLDTVGLAADFMTRYPENLSGGQRQRVALARALAAEPDLLVLDEPTSALDVSVQAKVLALLVDMQKRFDLAYVFITHDLSVVRNIARRVAVLYRGKIVEAGPVAGVFAMPRHRYTTMLLSSIPVVSADEAALRPAWPWDEPTFDEGNRRSAGCAFAPRCPFALERCWQSPPALAPTGDGHLVACHNPA
jgi:oligopeptide/dipeptide ABC transporter ATP-binding protein